MSSTVIRRATSLDWSLIAAGLLGLAAAIEVANVPGYSGQQSYVALLLGMGATVPLALARTSAAAAALPIVPAALLSLQLYGRLVIAALVSLLAVLYLLGRRGSRWVSALAAAPFVVYPLTALVGHSGPAPVGDGGPVPPGPGPDAHLPPSGSLPVVLAALAVGAVALGWVRRTRREAVDRDASRRAFADSLLEHAARGERARIARELHDVVAHHISMIAVQAETARLTTTGLPPEGARRLLAIGDTARTALTEMRRLLGVLREDAATEPTRRPQPGLHQLTELVDEVRDSTGTNMRLIVSGPVAPLDPGIQLTAYRIVQEALTNARRHAAGAAVDVELLYSARALRIRVRDNGPGPAPPSPGGTAAGSGGTAGGGTAAAGGGMMGEPVAGHGLLGMRERAAMVGGTLRVGPGPGGGFLVEAELPTPGGADP